MFTGKYTIGEKEREISSRDYAYIIDKMNKLKAEGAIMIRIYKDGERI